jgi:hypothetical protein
MLFDSSQQISSAVSHKQLTKQGVGFQVSALPLAAEAASLIENKTSAMRRRAAHCGRRFEAGTVAGPTSDFMKFHTRCQRK